MNNVTLMGRLTRDPDIRYTQGDSPTCIARYTLAVDRRYKRDGQPTADFISCIAFGRCGEFADRYLHKGTKIALQGRIQTGHYVNKDNVTVYTTDVVVESQEFAESKAASLDAQTAREQEMPKQQPDADGFMQMPDSIDEELPFT